MVESLTYFNDNDYVMGLTHSDGYGLDLNYPLEEIKPTDLKKVVVDDQKKPAQLLNNPTEITIENHPYMISAYDWDYRKQKQLHQIELKK